MGGLADIARGAVVAGLIAIAGIGPRLPSGLSLGGALDQHRQGRHRYRFWKDPRIIWQFSLQGHSSPGNHDDAYVRPHRLRMSRQNCATASAGHLDVRDEGSESFGSRRQQAKRLAGIGRLPDIKTAILNDGADVGANDGVVLDDEKITWFWDGRGFHNATTAAPFSGCVRRKETSRLRSRS